MNNYDLEEKNLKFTLQKTKCLKKFSKDYFVVIYLLIIRDLFKINFSNDKNFMRVFLRQPF